jgi:hypothetical protein
MFQGVETMIISARVFTAGAKASNHVTIQGNYGILPDTLSTNRIFFRKNGKLVSFRKETEYAPKELFSGKVSIDMGYEVVLHLDNGKATIENPRNMNVKIDTF